MTDWRKLFAATPRQTLSFFPPDTNNGSVLVSPPKEIFTQGAEEWKNSVIAQFLGQPPSLNLLHRVLPKLWEKKGTVSINQAGPNLFIFKFESDDICNWIIENGPWHVHHNMMVLRKWAPNTGKINFDLYKLPVWFHLHQIPLELYKREGISYLASAIGNPLYMDTVTASKKRLAYAKVCIEVTADKDPPETIDVMLEDGYITSIVVSIPWKPFVCKPCKTFGHSELACVKKTKQVWVEKAKAPIAQEATDEITETQKEPEKTENIWETLAAEITEEITQATPTMTKNINPKTTPQTSTTASKGKKLAMNKQLATWSLNVKHSITGSSNKYAALLEETAIVEDEEEYSEENERQREDNNEEIWQNLIDNASFSPRKTRVAAQGAAQVLIDMKGKKPKEVKPAKKARTGASTRGRKT